MSLIVDQQTSIIGRKNGVRHSSVLAVIGVSGAHFHHGLSRRNVELIEEDSSTVERRVEDRRVVVRVADFDRIFQSNRASRFAVIGNAKNEAWRNVEIFLFAIDQPVDDEQKRTLVERFQRDEIFALLDLPGELAVRPVVVVRDGNVRQHLSDGRVFRNENLRRLRRKRLQKRHERLRSVVVLVHDANLDRDELRHGVFSRVANLNGQLIEMFQFVVERMRQGQSKRIRSKEKKREKNLHSGRFAETKMVEPSGNRETVGDRVENLKK